MSEIVVLSVYQREHERNSGSPRWHLDWIEQGRRRSKTFTSRESADGFRKALLDPKELVLFGDMPLPSNAAAPPSTPLQDFQRMFYELMVARGCDGLHASNTRYQIEWICRNAEIADAAKITRTSVQLALGKLIAMGRSLDTANHYRRSIKSFTAWLADPEAGIVAGGSVLLRDPLAKLPKYKAATDRRHERVAPTLEQFMAIYAAVTRLNRRYYGVSAEDRMALYVGAVGTGLRLRALRALTVAQFRLEGLWPHVATEAWQEKGGKARAIQFKQWVASYLGSYFAGKLGSARAFVTPHSSNVVRMFRKDLADAGISPFRLVLVEGQPKRRKDVIDFHALRKAHAQWQANAGAPPKDLQQQLGHASMETTMKHYVDAQAGCAAQYFPDLPIAPPAQSA